MRLKEIMLAKGVTVKKLSELSGVSPRTIEQYTCGRAVLRNARAHIVISLAEALDVPPKDLIEDEVAE